MNIASYFCPFSKQFHATNDFKALTGWEKFKTVTLTALAAIATLPILGLGGVAVFRAMVGHYTKIDPRNPDDSDQEQAASRVDDLARSVIEERQREMEGVFGSLSASQIMRDTEEVVDDELTKSEEVKTDPKPLDQYSAEDVQAYIQLIKAGDPRVLEGADISFMEQFEKAKARALALHTEFKEKFDRDPSINQLGIANATLTQFKVAQKMLKKEFPGLSSLAFNAEQKCAVARLMQIIMCGEDAMEKPMPSSSNCFTIRELDRRVTPPTTEKKSDFLADSIEKLQAAKDNEGFDEHYKRNFLHAMHLFVNDCLNRTLNAFHIKEGRATALGRDVEEPAGFAALVRDQLVEELKEDPGKVKELIQEAKSQKSVVSWLKHWFPEDVGDELFSESLLKAVFAEEKKAFQEDEIVGPAIDQLIANCQLDDESVLELAAGSECSPEDIKSLVRVRLVQMMILMHQGFQQDHLVALLSHLHSYGEGGILHPKTVASIFVVPPNKLMSELKIDLFNEVIVTQPDFSNEGIAEYFERDSVSVAEVETVVNQSNFTSGETEQTIIGIEHLRVSWQITEGILDHLVGQINPDALSSQPKEKCPQLKEDLHGNLDLLDQIAKIQPQSTDTSSIWSWFSSPSVSEELQDVQRIAEVIGEVSENCHEFMKVVAILDEKGEGDLTLLQTARVKLINVTAALVELKRHYEVNQQDEQVVIIDEILGSIDSLVGQLPQESMIEQPKTYWKRLAGTFGQSQDSKDLEWKVHKYETQVLELRRLFEAKFKPNQLTQNMDGSWLVMDLDPSQGVIERLYATLTDLEINSADKKRYNQDYLAEVRHVINEQFIPAFRKEFDEDPNNIYLLQIAKFLFTEVDLQGQCYETLDTFNEMGAIALGQELGEVDPQAHGDHDFVKWVNTVYRRLGAVPYSAKAPLFNQWANSARGQWNRDFDPYRQGNPTHHFWNLQVGDRVVKMLGMGTPTHEDSNSVAHLNQEFVALMKSYKADGKRHLYVNNQNLIPKTGWLAYFINGDETARSDLILDLQDQEEVKGAYFAIALSKNSKFYWQKGEWADAKEASTFRDSLFYQVCKGPRHITGSYIPKTIRDLIPGFDEKAKNIIAQIHEKVFAGKDELTLEERRWFIELFYDNLQKMIIVEGEFDSANGSCKDQIDRGAGTNAQLAANCYVVAQKDGVLTEEQEDHVMMMMMVRALLVRKRPPLHERVERFCEGMDQTFKHVTELKELHEELFPGVQMMPQQVAVTV